MVFYDFRVCSVVGSHNASDIHTAAGSVLYQICLTVLVTAKKYGGV